MSAGTLTFFVLPKNEIVYCIVAVSVKTFKHFSLCLMGIKLIGAEDVDTKDYETS